MRIRFSLILIAIVAAATLTNCSDNSSVNNSYSEDTFNCDSLYRAHCVLKQQYASHSQVLRCYLDWFEMYRDSMKVGWPEPPYCPGRPVHLEHCIQ